jgi:hypothetical protein
MSREAMGLVHFKEAATKREGRQEWRPTERFTALKPFAHHGRGASNERATA